MGVFPHTTLTPCVFRLPLPSFFISSQSKLEGKQAMGPSLQDAADILKKAFALHKTAGGHGQTTLTTLSVIHQVVMS
jgi:hypothetical protein